MSTAAQGQGADAEKNIEIWKIKKLVKRLEAARGNGTYDRPRICTEHPHLQPRSPNPIWVAGRH